MPEATSKQSSPAPPPTRGLQSFWTKLGRNRSGSQYGSLHSLTSSAASTPSIGTRYHETASDKLSSLLGHRSGDSMVASSHAASDPFDDAIRPSISAIKAAQITSAMSKEDESLLWMKRTIQQGRLDGQADGVEIWTTNSGLLSMTWSHKLASGGIDLLKACTILSNESSSDIRIGYIRHMYYEQVRQAFVHAGGELDEVNLQGLVAVLEALTRGGREIFGLEGIMPLLLDIAARLTDLRQNQRLRHIDLRTARTPLLDSAFGTPFVRLPPEMLFISSDTKSSPAALIIACHRFSYSHIPHDTVRQTMSRFIFRGLQGLGEHEVSKVLEFIDTIVKFGYVPPANLEDTVKFVARVVGIEGRILVVDVSPDGDRRMLALGSDLPDQAHGVMTNLLRSPANQALKHLRAILSTPTHIKGESSQCPTPLLIGTLRSLRRAYKEYEAVVSDLQIEDPSTSAPDNYPTLLSLGMTVLHQNLLDVLEWRSDDVDSEVLLFLEERFSSRTSEKKYFSYDEWEMVISILEKMTWHIQEWEEASGKPWSIENANSQTSRRLPTHSSKSEAAPATVTTTPFSPVENTPSSTNLPVLASFSLVINRMLNAQALDTFTGSHLRFFDFLLTVARHLSNSALVSFFNFTNARQLNSPGRSDWLERMQNITSVFFPSTPYSYIRETVRSGRRAVLQLLDDAYCKAQGHHVNELMEAVIFPLWEQQLRHEQDAAVVLSAFTLMEKCSIDCLPRDDQTSDRLQRFDRLVAVVVNLAWQETLQGAAPAPDRSESNASAPTSPDRAASRTSLSGADVGFSAAQLLVKIFYQLVNASSTRCSHYGVRCFREMLRLVSTGTSYPIDGHLPSKRARFVVLQCLVRLRADQRHRVFSRQHLEYEELARYLGRMPESDNGDAIRGRDRGRPRTRRDLMTGPEDSKSPASTRGLVASRSRTRARETGTSPSRQRPTQTSTSNSLWSYPDILPFAFPTWPVCSTGSRGIASFDHVNMQDWSESVAVDGGDVSMAELPAAAENLVILPVSEYLLVVQDLLANEKDWDIVSLLLCTLPTQLANKHFACGPRAARKLQAMCQYLCERLNKDDLCDQVQLPTNVRRSDMHAAAYQWLATLIAYRDLFRREKQNEMVVTFLRGLSKTPNIAKPSIHALTMACYEFESSMSKYLPEILGSLVRIMSTVNMPVHILELVASIGHIKSLYANFTEDDYKKVFAVGVQYLSTHYENLLDDPSSGIVPEELDKALVHAFGQYVFLLSFYVIALWYTIIPTSERARYTSFVVHRLLRAVESHGHIDAATEVSLDMLARLAYVPSNPYNATIERPSEEKTYTSWVIANSIITLEMYPDAVKGIVTIRRPSGIIRQAVSIDPQELVKDDILGLLYRNRKAFQVDALVYLDTDHTPNSPSYREDAAFSTLLLPPHDTFSRYGLPLRIQPSEHTRRALSVLDNIPHIDSHKIGVLYMGPQQTTEQELLKNVHGSRSYSTFLAGLGSLTRLQGHRGYTGGLDREADFDGRWTYIWSDDIQQMIFHVATLMPTRQEDPQCNYKKRHIGNDYVKIIFNDSLVRPPFDILPGQFNFINIVIEPHTPAGDAWKGEMGIASNTEFFRVSMQQRSDMPEMGPLGIFKMVSTESLPAFVRELALHANLFAQLFLQSVGVQGKSSANRQKVEYTSTWRNRLEAIKRFRDHVQGDNAASNQGVNLVSH